MSNPGGMNNLNEVSPTEMQAEGSPPPLPHFDEEATMLSARPVVPIQVAEASKNRRSYLVQGAILLAAALLGAAIALSVDFFQKRQAITTTAGAEPAEVSTEPAAPSKQDSASQTLNTSQPGSPTSKEPVVQVPTTKAPATAPQSELNAGM